MLLVKGLCLLFEFLPSLWSPFLVLLIPITPICGGNDIVFIPRVFGGGAVVFVAVVVVEIAVAIDVEEEDVVVGLVDAIVTAGLLGVVVAVPVPVPVPVPTPTPAAVAVAVAAAAAAAITDSNFEGSAAAVRCTTSTLDMLSLFPLFSFTWCVSPCLVILLSLQYAVTRPFRFRFLFFCPPGTAGLPRGRARTK